MSKYLIIGGTGALGSRIREALSTDPSIDIYIGAYDQETDTKNHIVYCDVNDIKSIKQAIQNMDVVIVATRQKTPNVQAVCAETGTLCIDVTVEFDFVQSIIDKYENDAKARLVVMCGFFPGFSAVIANYLATQFDDVQDIKIALLQNTNAKVGRTGVADMLRKVSQNVELDGNTVKGFSKPYDVDFGFTVPTVTTRLVRYDERKALQRTFPNAAIGYYTAWNSRMFSSLISLLRKTGILSFLLNHNVKLVPKHNPNKPETVYLTVEATGTKAGTQTTKKVHLKTASDYGITGKFIAAAAKNISFRKTNGFGVAFPYELISFDEIVTALGDGVEIVET